MLSEAKGKAVAANRPRKRRRRRRNVEDEQSGDSYEPPTSIRSIPERTPTPYPRTIGMSPPSTAYSNSPLGLSGLPGLTNDFFPNCTSSPQAHLVDLNLAGET